MVIIEHPQIIRNIWEKNYLYLTLKTQPCVQCYNSIVGMIFWQNLLLPPGRAEAFAHLPDKMSLIGLAITLDTEDVLLAEVQYSSRECPRSLPLM